MYTSIILTSFIEAKFQAHLTMACIANITRYTNPDEYELIVMNAGHSYAIRDDYHCLKIDKMIETDLGYTASMNEGAAQAKGDILVFLQNDVFVWEGWLPKMRWYIENHLAECVIPDQCPRPRKFVEESYLMDNLTAMKYGSRDAGCLMITKEGFQRTGGWDPDLSLLAEKDFYARLGAAGVGQIDTCKVMISHIMAGSNLYLLHTNPEEYERRMSHDAQKLNS